MAPEEFELAMYGFRDYSAVIAAGKVQRWEVVKWVVTVNLALATASIPLREARGLFFCFAVFVAVLGGVLLYHYNQRMTNARSGDAKLCAYMRSQIPHLDHVLSAETENPKPFSYDKQEMTVFSYVMILSVFPTFVALLLL